jgi:hypothetical protein
MKTSWQKLLSIVSIITISFLAATAAYSWTPEYTGIGEIANNLMAPVSLLSSLLYTLSILIGLLCLFSTFVRYREYRRNYIAMPLSKVIFMFVMAVILIAAPLVYKLTSSGIPYDYPLPENIETN